MADDTSRLRTLLENTRASFAKGMAALQLLVDKNSEQIEDLQERNREHLDRINELERELAVLRSHVPDELQSRLRVVEDRVKEMRGDHKDITGKVRTLEMRDASGELQTEQRKIQVEEKKSNRFVIAAIITAGGSILIQVVKWIFDMTGG